MHPILDEGGRHEQGEDTLQQPDVPDYLHLAFVHGRHAVLSETFFQNLGENVNNLLDDNLILSYPFIVSINYLAFNS